MNIKQNKNGDRNLKCFTCGASIEDDDYACIGDEARPTCSKCLEVMVENPPPCPNCGKEVSSAEEVGLVLTPKGSTPEEKANAIDVLVVVCPHCRILYFDDFNYKIIRGLRKFES